MVVWGGGEKEKEPTTESQLGLCEVGGGGGGRDYKVKTN